MTPGSSSVVNSVTVVKRSRRRIWDARTATRRAVHREAPGLVRALVACGPGCNVSFSKGHPMPPGRLTTLTLRLTPADQQTLRAWQRSTTLPAGLARRGRLLLLRAEGMPICTIAATVGISRRFVYKWVRRFLAQGLAGLADTPGRGARSRRLSTSLAARPSVGTAGDTAPAE